MTIELRVGRGGSSSDCRQVADPHQVVSRSGQGEHPADPGHAAMPRLAQHRHGLEPAESLFHPLAPPLTQGIAKVAAGALVDRARWLLCNVGRDVMVAQMVHERSSVIALVGAERHAPIAGDVTDHGQGGLTLRPAGGLGQPGIDYQAVAILHQQMTQVAQLGLPPTGLLIEPCLRIGGRLMGRVAPPLAMKIDARIAGIVGRTWLRVLARETLVPGPGLDQGAVDGEVLGREQALSPRLGHHLMKKGLRHFTRQQPLAVLGKDRHVPYGIVHTQANEPAKQQIVIKLLHQLPLAAYRVQYLQQQRAQQLLRRNRRASALCIKRIEPPAQLPQRGIGHRAHRPQRVIFRHPALGRYVTEHPALFAIRPTHPLSLRQPPLAFHLTCYRVSKPPLFPHPVKAVVALECFISEALATWDIALAFAVRFCRNLKRQTDKHTIEKQLKAGGVNLSWVRMRETLRNWHTHEGSIWVAIEVSSDNPRTYKLIILRRNTRDLLNSQDWIAWDELEDFYKGLNQGVMGLRTWLLKQLDPAH